MSTASKALSYWKQMEKKAKAEKKKSYNFKISRRRKNTLKRGKFKKMEAEWKKENEKEAKKPEIVKEEVKKAPEPKQEPVPEPKKEVKAVEETPKPEPKPEVKKVEPKPEPEPVKEEPVPAPKEEPVPVKEEPTPAAAQIEENDDELPFPCIAKYDFVPEEETELSVKGGESVLIVQISETGWCLAQNKDGKEGWVPMDFLTRIEDEKLEKKANEEIKANDATKKSAAPAEPSRVSPLGEENQKLFEYLTTSHVFQKARSKGEMKVQIEDLHYTLAAGAGIESTLAMMKYLDEQKEQHDTFASLQAKLQKLRGEWSEHRMILKAKKKWTDEDSKRVMYEALGGTETLELLKTYTGDAEGAIKLIVQIKKDRREDEEKGRTAVLDYLSSQECTLFKENCSVSQSALDALFHGSTAAKVLEKVKDLNKQKKSFDSFEELVQAVSGKKVAKTKGGDKSFQPVLRYLSSPQCNLFRNAAGGVRVTSNAIRELLQAYDTDVQRLLCDVAILNALGVELQKFVEIKSALERKDVKAYKENLFGLIKDPKGTHFTTVPTEFPEDEMYGILAVSSTRIDFLPQILRNMPEGVDDLDDLCMKVDDIVQEKAKQEAGEQEKVVKFLQTFGIFSKQFPLTLGDVQKLIWTSQFSKWGLTGGSVEDVLKALHDAQQVFDSFEGLTKAVSEKAEKMGAAMLK
mmetsp:Transcript_12623/g.18894  ORF Transcript_12623/g.18894 Transcript_12623/m.18894 type:complete len:689 (-) Transcript_12623:106-2172(-)|eukprot:CAMPEP_0167756252 /NCGR_PEP_ID=MMETSP0110_2-20121227/9281_1 /TAXON_ID=629695 /ORGANISM="Gymnochlora sp., Strain CCMP2014" /LENGTH=688 /DNA_ID=CAMNT_0007642339 /DNA_START=34 /DNA_END=2100 /DNA_ORIENTATION=-